MVDLRRNDGMSRQDSNSNSNSNSDSDKSRPRIVEDDDDEEEGEGEEGELGDIIADEKNRIDEAYRIGG